MELFGLFAVELYEIDSLMGIYASFEDARAAAEARRAGGDDGYMEVRSFVLGAAAEFRFESGIAV